MDNGRNTQFPLKSTNIFNAGGNHQLRYGVAFEDIYYLQGTSRTGPTFTLPDGTQTTTGASIQIRPDPDFGSIYRVTRAQIGPGRETTQKYYSLFLQDTWQIGKRLTLAPRHPLDHQKLTGQREPGLLVERGVRRRRQRTAATAGRLRVHLRHPGAPAWARPTTSRATASPSCSRPGAAST